MSKPPKSTVFELMPPEAVPIKFERSSIGSRFGAQFVDLAITYLVLIVVVLLVIYLMGLNQGALSFVIILAFLLRSPYYIFTELVWNGQTLGKKICKICVVSANGNTLTPYQVVVRNLLKEAEVFLPISLLFGFGDTGWTTKVLCFFWLCITLFYPILSKKNQRLGDVIAGTYVVEKPKIKFLKDIAEAQTNRTQYFIFDPEQLNAYGRFELQTLEDILREESGSEALEKKKRAANAIHKKIRYPQPIPSGKHEVFLEDFYMQQRQYLEGRSLFGDVREDKFYNTER